MIFLTPMTDHPGPDHPDESPLTELLFEASLRTIREYRGFVRSFMFSCYLGAHFSVCDRDKVFPTEVADSSHSPFFSIEQPEEWITTSGYDLYVSWKEETQRSGGMVLQYHGVDASLSESKAFRSYVIVKKNSQSCHR